MADHKLRLIIEGVDNASGQIKGVSSALGDMGKIAGGLGIAAGVGAITAGVIDMGRAALDSFAKYEQLSLSLNSLAAKEALLSGQASTMAGAMAATSAKAKELVDWTQKLAIESPFKQEDVAGAFRMSMALGFSTSEAQRLTQAMLDFSAATGSSGYTMERIAMALGQARTAGRLTAGDLNQLTAAGVDVMRVLSEGFGMTPVAIREEMEAGRLEANKAIDLIIADMERLYGGAGKATANSFSGILSTLGELGDTAGRNLFGGIFQAAQPYLAEITGVFSAPEFQAGVTAVGAVLGTTVSKSLETAAGYMTDISDAMDKFPKEIPAPLAFLFAAPNPSQAGSVAADLMTIQATFAALSEGNLELAFSIVYAEQDPEVQAAMDWVKWFASEANREYTATVNFLGNVGESFNQWAGWFTAEADREIDATVNFLGFVGDFWTQWGTWLTGEATREISLTANWISTTGAALQAGIDTWFTEPVLLAASWMTNVSTDLWDGLTGMFGEPVMLAASWLSETLGGLWDAVQGWFNANPISVKAQTSYTPETQPPGVDPNGYPADVTPPMPEYQADPRYWTPPQGARGFKNFRGGLALVGEEGPELVVLPAGADVIPNDQTMRMIPGFAEGTTGGAAGFGNALQGMLQAIGLWVPQNNPNDDYATRHMQKAATDTANAFGDAALATSNAFADAAGNSAQDWTDTFQSALQGVEGLFGTSSVTSDQMRMAELGVPQNFADDYLRRLSDEVLNGKDWGADVDIKDAAARAGIDPNLPAEVILELVKQAWNNSSLFANAANLDLINQDAVKAAIEQQQAEAAGKANILSLFGLTDENLEGQVDGLGQALSSVFGGAADSDAMKAAGAQVFAGVASGFQDENTASLAVGNAAGAVLAAAGNADNQAALMNVGATWFDILWKGFAKAAGAASVPAMPNPPGAGGTATTPPGKALGGYASGWTVVGEFGPELINAPAGSRVYDAATTRKLRATAAQGRTTIVNQHFSINDRLSAEMVARKAVDMIKRGG